MAYFSNGTEGEMYEDKYCSRCIHNTADPQDALTVNECPVLEVHLIYNYDQHRKTKEGVVVREILSTLIPMIEGEPYADECSMFIEGSQFGKGADYLRELQFTNRPVYGEVVK